MNAPNSTTPLDMLLMLQIRGEISAEQHSQLQKSLRENTSVLDYCLEFLIVCAGLEPVCQEDNSAALTRLKSVLRHHPVKPRSSVRDLLRSSYKIAAMLMLGCLAAFGLVKMLQQTRTQGLAQVVNGLAAKWEDASIATGKGTALAKGPKHLLEGVAQLKMAGGARLLVQAPCQFTLEDKNSIRLANGAITASVSRKARGFTVRTKDCTVVDYGTEFGIRVQPDVQTEVHVFSGKVTLKPSQPAAGQAKEVSVQANQAALVKPSAPVTIKTANPTQFMRTLPAQPGKAAPGRQLSLADIVGGGNGYGNGKSGQGIDIATGGSLQAPSEASLDQRGAFIMLMAQKYIDGVFSPNSRLGDVTISTTELVFAECPQTANCFVGGVFKHVQAGSDSQVLRHQCNTGITFDLDRLRADNPGLSIQGLDTACRISSSTLRTDQTMDFWILVDGKAQIHRQLKPSDRSTEPISVKLEAGSRFLSLVTSCPNNAKDCWGEFVDPMLSLAPRP